MTSDPYSPGFTICRSKGFHIKFPNGWVVSTQCGPGNYCEGYPHSYRRTYRPEPKDVELWKSPDAEIWYWNVFNEDLDCGDPVGWQSPHDLLRLLNALAFLPTPVYWGA